MMGDEKEERLSEISDVAGVGVGPIQRVAVIGAGGSGLAAIKSCLEEGLTPVCFERQNDIGGWWRYQPAPTHPDGQHNCVMSNGMSRSSKEMFGYSDFPPLKDHPNFLTHSRVMEYLRRYCARFNLVKHIRFERRVLRITPSADYDTTGRWKVRYRTRSTFHVDEEEFDGVMLCTGFWNNPFVPCIPGASKFKGTILHACDYKNDAGFKDKRVGIVGIGRDGVAIATDLALSAAQVYLCVEDKAWIQSRLDKGGQPWDLNHVTRLESMVMSQIPLANSYSEYTVNCHLNHHKFALAPDFSLTDIQLHDPLVVADGLALMIQSGRVLPKPGVAYLEEKSIVFKDETKENGLDAVIFDTGYNLEMPFDQYPDDSRGLNLYLDIFPVELTHKTLAMIGVNRSSNGGDSLSLPEMQTRLTVQVWSREVQFLSHSEIENDIQTTRKNRCFQDFKQPPTVDYIEYMDKLAGFLGCRPLLLATKFPHFDSLLLNSPAAGYQYRMEGPHAWSQARTALRKTIYRSEYPIKAWNPDYETNRIECVKVMKESVESVRNSENNLDGNYRRVIGVNFFQAVSSILFTSYWLVRVIWSELILQPSGVKMRQRGATSPSRRFAAGCLLFTFIFILFLRLFI